MARVECCHQLDAMDCGPASLKMIAAYYGKEYSIQTLRDYCHITREGVSMQGINEAAERVNGGSVFIFELKDLEVIEISYTFANRNKNVTNMPRSTRKKSKTGICHVILRVNTESHVHKNRY